MLPAMQTLGWVCLAGAVGSGLRYLIGVGTARWFGEAFPVGTLVVNVLGCFAIAVVMHAATVGSLSETTRVALATGLLGGLTTYSAFNHETTALLAQRGAGPGLLNLGVTVVGCLVAGWLGLLLARRIF